jgi:signal transduction histidine kinase
MTRGDQTTLARLVRQVRNSPLLARIRVRLVILVLLAVFPALGVVIYTAVEQRREGFEHARNETLRLVRTAANTHAQSIESARQLLLALAELPAIQNRDSNACYSAFTNLVALHELYSNFGALNTDGSPIALLHALDRSIEVTNRDFFRTAIERGTFSVPDYYLDWTTRRAAVIIGYPLRSRGGDPRPDALLFAAIDLNWLYRMHSDAELPAGSSITVSDPHRITILRHPDPGSRFLGEQLAPSRRRGPRPLERTSISRGRDGVLRLYAFAPLGRAEENSASIAVGIPVAQAHAVANAALRRNVIALSVAALLALAAAWFGGEFFILRRLRRLVSTTERLTHGDLSARTGVARGDGELHQLARAFDQMAESLQQRVAERERAEGNLRSLNQNLEQRVAARTLELKRSNEELEQFAYVASHDLQEPLRMVTNYLQLLENRYKTQLDPKAQDFITIAVDGATRMHQLIGDLLTYSRVGTAAKPLAPTDVKEVLKNALLNLKVAIDESRAKITSGPLPMVMGDPIQLMQLFQNLIGNAIKFRSDKPLEIQISAEHVQATTCPVPPFRAETTRNAGGANSHEPTSPTATPSTPNEWQFAVRDNGIGIAAKDFDRIFLIFQRLHTREKYPGTGIGLALCKKIVERHGGRIWVESEPGQGATFFFTLQEAPANSAS